MATTSDVVLFLGAGFSRDAQLPLMGEFGRESLSTQADIERNAKARNAGPAILQAKQTYIAFQKLCVQTKLLTPSDWYNVEEVFGVAETLKYAGIKHVTLSGRRTRIDDVIARIQTWIWKTYQQLPVKRGSKRLPVNRAPYQELFSLLRDYDLATRTTIITTNYDIVAEYFAYLASTPAHYAVDWNSSHGVGSRLSWFVSTPRATPTGPLVCKLHGSVNYFELRSGELLVAADLGDGKEWIGKTPPASFKNEPTIAMYDAIWKLQQSYAGAQPAIVPPSYAKLQQRPWLSQTWGSAAAALGSAKTVIFIGYSLPPSDGALRALLVGSRIHAASGAGPQRVMVIDTSRHVRREYRKLYHAIEPRVVMRFARAMQRVIPDVLRQAAGA